MTKPIDITNQRFGRLVAIQPAGNDVRGAQLWLCQCDCGKTQIASAGRLRYGAVKSCGCYRNDGHSNYRHGGRDTPTYYIWCRMIQRCNNPKSSNFQYYGGRGITVCERWTDYKNFLTDIGERPDPNLSIDRINNNGNYEPDNVRWATRKEQRANRR